MQISNGMSYSKTKSISQPKNEIIASLDRHLHECDKPIGKVFDNMMRGLATKQIVSAMGYQASQFDTVRTFERAILAMRSDIAVKRLNPHTRSQLGFALDMLIKRSDDDNLTLYLEAKKSELKSGDDSRSRLMLLNSGTMISQSSMSIAPITDVKNESGVYVYSYPQYITSESTKDGRKSFYKIGSSTVGVANRVKDQGRSTPMPEDIVILRVFYCENPKKVEKQFHDILKVAEMHHKSIKGGTEWFKTDIAFIDAIAAALGLEPNAKGLV